MRRAFRSIEKILKKKVAALPDGGFAIIIRCAHKPKRGKITRIVHRVAGTPGMRHELEAAEDAILGAHGQFLVPEEHEDLAGRYLRIPVDAEIRAAKAREFLKMAWKTHVVGTPWEGKKQMYKVVRRHPEAAFGWWEEVVGPHVAFENTSVADRTVSRKLYEHLGRTLFAAATHRPEIDQRREPVVAPTHACRISIFCVKEHRHRGRCKLSTARLDEEPVPAIPAIPDAEPTAIPDAIPVTIRRKAGRRGKKKKAASKPEGGSSSVKKKRPRVIRAIDSNWMLRKRESSRRHEEAAAKKVRALERSGFIIA